MFPYHDTRGKLTIGVGRNLTDDGITGEEAKFLLTNDIKKVRYQAQATFPWFNKLSPVRQNVVLDMIFNLGLGGFETFHNFISALSTGNFNSASQFMLQSKWANQVGYRATELSEMLRLDV